MKIWLSTVLGIALTSTSLLAKSDIVTTAARAGSFQTLVTLLNAAELEDDLRGDGSFTVFAPTDAAFAKLPAETLQALLQPENQEQLASILKYHVIGQRLNVPMKPPSHPITSSKTLLGEKIRFQRTGSEVKVNEANIVQRDIRCSNGNIQVIDQVLLPPQGKPTIASVAKEAGAFTTLLAAVEAAGLTEALTGEGPLTVFAPTDDAFAKLPKGTVESLLKPENRKQLKAILTYHVVSGRVSADAAIQAQNAKTLMGSPLSFRINDGRLKVNDANVVKNDIDAGNGVIHIIDSVLLPPDHR